MSDFKISQLPSDASPLSTNLIPEVSNGGTTSSITLQQSVAAGSLYQPYPLYTPQGRLTLTSGAPVMTSAVM